MTKKKNATTETENVLGIILPLVPIICFFSFMSVVMISSWIMSSNDELLVYSQDEINTICKDLKISSEDVFCSHNSEQNMETFIIMLEHNYPPNETTYFDIFPLMSMWSSSNWSCNQDGANSNMCLSSQCYEYVHSNDLYLCIFDTPVESDELRIYVNKSTGIIEKYEIISNYEYL
jgi:hypothetical protein